MHVSPLKPYDRATAVRNLSDGQSVRSDRGIAWKSPAPVALPYAYSPHVGDTSWHATAGQALTAFEKHYNASIPNA